MTTWNVGVHRPGCTLEIGQVQARTEALARCAALSRWGVSEDELQTGTVDLQQAITPADDFDVSPAL